MSSESRSRTRARPVIEGPEAAARFEKVLGQVIAVPKAELQRREAAYQETRRTKKSRRTTK